MSFTLGVFDTNDVTDFKAILQEWPVLPVDLQLDELPAGDGSLFYRARMTETEWVFNLELTGTNIADVMAKADVISKALNPKLHKMQDFTPNAMDPYVWRGVLSSPIAWERDKVIWFSDQGVSRLSGQAVITTPNPHGFSVQAPITIAAAGNLVLPGGGTTSYYPVIKFRGVLSAAQSFAMIGTNMGGNVQVPGPLTANDEFVFDFDKMEFYRFDRGNNKRLYNIADKFAQFSRLEVQPTGGTLFCLVDAGTFTRVEGIPTFRRI